MTTTTFSNKSLWTWGRYLLNLMDHLKRLIGAPIGNKTACEELAEIEKAFRTLLLAGNPGEDYEVIAARIDEEAARYKAFLQKPEAIRKIVLKVKELKGGAFVTRPTREQIHVIDPSEGRDDPAEGRASLCYSFCRSDHTVLEFFVYDEEDNPLFPIARTYTDWIGEKEFDLGRNRTFYLNMCEDQMPGYVQVYAGFVPVMCAAKYPLQTNRKLAYFPTPSQRKGGWGRWLLSFLWPAPVRMFGQVGIEAVLVSLVCCSIFWTTMVSPMTKAAVLHESAGSRDASAANSTPTSITTEGETGAAVRPDVTPSRRPRFYANQVLDASRLHRFQKVSVSIDDASCRDEAQWRELWANVQHAVQARMDALSAKPVTLHDTNQSDDVKLVVSFQPLDWKHGHVVFTLYDSNEAVVSGSHDFDCARKRFSVLDDAFCSETSWQLIGQMLTGYPFANSQEGEGHSTVSDVE